MKTASKTASIIVTPEAIVAPEAIVTPEAVIVTVSKSKTEVATLDASLSPVMTMGDVTAAVAVTSSLALNFLAGNVHADILACKNISTSFPRMGNADKQALRVLLPLKAENIRASWATYVASLKSLRGVSLQALAKAAKGKAATATESFKDRVIAWATLPENKAAFDALPRGLADLIIDILPEEKV